MYVHACEKGSVIYMYCLEGTSALLGNLVILTAMKQVIINDAQNNIGNPFLIEIDQMKDNKKNKILKKCS